MASNDIRKGLLICKLCKNNTRDPKSLPCLHAFCTACLHTLAQEKTSFECPQCRVRTEVPPGGVTEFHGATYLIALAEYIQLFSPSGPSIPCFNKEEDDDEHHDAAIKCKECDAYYCQTCDTAHKKSKLARNHTAIKLADFKEDDFKDAAQKKAIFCQRHPDSPVEYLSLCIARKHKFLCKTCIADSQIYCKIHGYQAFGEIAKKRRKDFLKSMNDDMKKNSDLLITLSEELRTALEKNDEYQKRKEKIIEEYTSQMGQLVLDKTEHLLQRENKYTNDIRENYTEILHEVQGKLASLENLQAVIQNMTSYSSDDVLFEQNEFILKKIETALEDSKLPEFWTQLVSVITEGPPSIENRFFDHKEMKNIYPGHPKETVCDQQPTRPLGWVEMW